MATRLAPDAILAQTNLSGSVTAIQDDPDSPDGSWLTAPGSNNNTAVRVSFPSPTADLRAGAGLQEFRVLVRKTNHNTNPTCAIELWEGGTLRSTLVSGQSIGSTSGTVLSATWDASVLSDISGANVEVRVTGTTGGGNPNNRASLEVGAIEWNATTQAPALSGTGSITQGHTAVATMGAKHVTGGTASLVIGGSSSETLHAEHADLDEGVDTPDGVYVTLISESAKTVASVVAFPTPSSDPGGQQTIRVRTQGSGGVSTPPYTLYVRDGSTQIASQAGTAANGSWGVETITFDAADLTDPTGAGVNLRILLGADPLAPQHLRIDAADWDAALPASGIVMTASGEQGQSNDRSGTGSLSSGDGVLVTGAKGGSGAGAASATGGSVSSGQKAATGSGSTSATASLTASGSVSIAKSGTGATSSTAGVTVSGSKAVSGTGAASVTTGASASGTAAEAHSGTGSTSATTAATASGQHSAGNAGSASVTTATSQTGAKAASGTGAASATIGTTATGSSAEAHEGTGATSATSSGTASGSRQATGTGAASHETGAAATGQHDGVGSGSATAATGSSPAGTKATSGAGLFSSSATATASGTTAESAEGTGSFAASASVIAAGSRQAAGDGSANGLLIVTASAFRTAMGVGLIASVCSGVSGGRKSTAAAAALATGHATTATGSASEASENTGQMSSTASTTALGAKAVSGEGTVAAVDGLSILGRKVALGVGVATLASLVATVGFKGSSSLVFAGLASDVAAAGSKLAISGASLLSVAASAGIGLHAGVGEAVLDVLVVATASGRSPTNLAGIAYIALSMGASQSIDYSMVGRADIGLSLAVDQTVRASLDALPSTRLSMGGKVVLGVE